MCLNRAEPSAGERRGASQPAPATPRLDLRPPAAVSPGAGPRYPPGSGRAAADEVDRNVPGAVSRVLEQVLGERVAQATAVDATFGRDVAERVERFTLLGGKRLRSQFLWWGMRFCAGESDVGDVNAALRVACALELVQTCALVHDDVMDGSALRRGRPAVHTDFAAQYAIAPASALGVPFGKAAAVLTGDLALAWADDAIADTVLAADVQVRVRQVWRDLRTEMVGGQYLDLHGQITDSRSMARALRVACLKSALYTVERPLALGAALAGADQATVRTLCAAGRCAGIAFQLRDDLLSVFGDPEYTGKPAGEDVRQGKLTYLVAVARARADAEGDSAALSLLDEALGDASLSESGLASVRSALVATGAVETVEKKIDSLVSHSGRCLAAAGGEYTVRRRLGALFRAVSGPPTGVVGAGPSAMPLSSAAVQGSSR